MDINLLLFPCNRKCCILLVEQLFEVFVLGLLSQSVWVKSTHGIVSVRNVFDEFQENRLNLQYFQEATRLLMIYLFGSNECQDSFEKD